MNKLFKNKKLVIVLIAIIVILIIGTAFIYMANTRGLFNKYKEASITQGKVSQTEINEEADKDNKTEEVKSKNAFNTCCFLVWLFIISILLCI